MLNGNLAVSGGWSQGGEPEAKGGDTSAKSGDAYGGDGGDAKAIGGDAEASNEVESKQGNSSSGHGESHEYDDRKGREGRPQAVLAAQPLVDRAGRSGGQGRQGQGQGR